MNAYYAYILELTHSFNKHVVSTYFFLESSFLSHNWQCRDLHSSLSDTVNAKEAVPWNSWLQPGPHSFHMTEGWLPGLAVHCNGTSHCVSVFGI